MALELRTLVFLYFVVNLVAAVALGVLWHQHRHRARGLGLWFTNTLLQVFALGCLALRGTVPDLFSMVAANVAAQVGVVCVLWGLQRFLQRPLTLWPNLAFLVVFVVAFSWFALVDPRLTVRDLLIAAGLVWTMGQATWLLFVRVRGPLRSACRLMGAVTAGFVLVNVVRFVALHLSPHRGNDFYGAGSPEAVALFSYLLLTLLLLVTQMLLVTRRLLDNVSAQEEKFTKAFHSSPYAVLLTQADGRVLELNEGFEELTGFRRAEVLGKTTMELGIWASVEERERFVQEVRRTGKVRNLELPFRRKSGEGVVGLVSAETIEFDGQSCILSCIGDVTEQDRMRSQLRELATHDALTGLPNRRLLADRFSVARSNVGRKRSRLALMSLDLDQFKAVNDTWGHEVGDRVLVEAAQRLSSSLRQSDTVSRFGGDEFVLLVWEVESPGDAATVALKILERFRVPFSVAGQSIILHASIGIALCPDDGDDLETLLRKSDEALYAVKAQGRNHYRFAPPVG